MVITYAGGYCFKLSAGDTTIALNPPSSKSSHKVSKFGADIALIPAAHPDWDGEETVSLGGKEPFIIRGPGAYEVGDAVVTGYASPGALEKDGNLPTQAGDFQNTIYAVQFDGMYILSLGALSSGKLPQEARGDLNDIDILFVPVGGETLSSKDAHELAVSLEPKLIIPYEVGKGKELAEFLKAEGSASVKPVEKLTLRAKEVAAMSGEVAVFK